MDGVRRGRRVAAGCAQAAAAGGRAVLRLPRVDGLAIRKTRLALGMTRSVFADRLGIKRRTLERWEQGRSRPGHEASALILLVRAFGDTLERLASLDLTLHAAARARRARAPASGGGRARRR